MLAVFLLVASAQVASGLEILPTGDVFNPYRVTYIAAEKGFCGDVVPFHAQRFDYPLAPHVRTTEATKISLVVRTDGDLVPYEPIVLSGVKDGVVQALVLHVDPPAKGRTARWQWKTDGKIVREESLKEAVGTDWVEVVAPSAGFAVDRFAVLTWIMDELKMTDPVFDLTLDWEKRSYAARLTVKESRKGARVSRIIGTDNFAVTLDPERRDCPRLKLDNSHCSDWRTNFHFEAVEELSGKRLAWTQAVDCPVGCTVYVSLAFPERLTTGLWHLSSDADARRDFCVVERRNEAKGPDKFAWHHVTKRGVGGVIDAYAVPVLARYIHVPMVFATLWLVDGKKGDPHLPPEAWHWNYGCETDYLEGYPLMANVQLIPCFDWQREQSDMPLNDTFKRPWGPEGGVPKAEVYVPVLREIARRYGDRVVAWELENEPNLGLMRTCPEYYVEYARVAYEGLKKTRPKIPLYGPCGTGDFSQWMKKAVAAGAGKYLDGPSWHTYTTPYWPDKVGVAGILHRVRACLDGKKGINTEVAVSCVGRHALTNMISRTEVLERRARHEKGYYRNGWPNWMLDEDEASASLARNVAVNFYSGSTLFTFFGSVSAKPGSDWRNSIDGLRLVAIDDAGNVGPSRVTLAVGVIAAQLESALTDGAKQLTGAKGADGLLMRKTNGGSVAVVWSTEKETRVEIAADVPFLEKVDVYGRAENLSPVRPGVFSLLLGESPFFLHTAEGELSFQKGEVVKTARNRKGPTGGTIGRVTRGDLSKVSAWRMDDVEQVVVGRASETTSLHLEDLYWNGPEELSARVRAGYDATNLLLQVEVTDKFMQMPKGCGVGGTSVEFFFDFRTTLAHAAFYSKGAYQFVIVPATEKSPLAVMCPQLPEVKQQDLPIVVTSRLTKTGYVLDVSVPWSLSGGDGPKPTFGFDVGVNGGDPGKANRRKTQMMLFGTQHNAVSAADFGRLRLR